MNQSVPEPIFLINAILFPFSLIQFLPLSSLVDSEEILNKIVFNKLDPRQQDGSSILIYTVLYLPPYY